MEIAKLIIPSFIAGMLTILAPCTLPLVPAYIGFISGVSLEDLKDPQRATRARFKIFMNSCAFILGFSTVFIIFGTMAGLIGGTILAPYRLWLGRIGGAFVVLFGLFMLGAPKLPFLAKERRLRVPVIFERGRPINSLILGSAFAVGWTPCVGPILGAILTLAAVSTTALQGAFLLSVFSLGLAVPFLLIAVATGSASRFVYKSEKYLNLISIAGGAFFVILGILLITDSFSLLVLYAYNLFDFINYNHLLDYL
jgi:cytochrome c-type biogenesis protein